jgi:hypothetical protein
LRNDRKRGRAKGEGRKDPGEWHFLRERGKSETKRREEKGGDQEEGERIGTFFNDARIPGSHARTQPFPENRRHQGHHRLPPPLSWSRKNAFERFEKEWPYFLLKCIFNGILFLSLLPSLSFPLSRTIDSLSSFLGVKKCF